MWMSTGGTLGPLKISQGMIVTVLICFLSIYILSALDGMNARVPQIAAAILDMVALMALLLLGFASSLRPLIGSADTFLPAQKKFLLQHWLYHLDPNNPPEGQISRPIEK